MVDTATLNKVQGGGKKKWEGRDLSPFYIKTIVWFLFNSKLCMV